MSNDNTLHRDNIVEFLKSQLQNLKFKNSNVSIDWTYSSTYDNFIEVLNSKDFKCFPPINASELNLYLALAYCNTIISDKVLIPAMIDDEKLNELLVVFTRQDKEPIEAFFRRRFNYAKEVNSPYIMAVLLAQYYSFILYRSHASSNNKKAVRCRNALFNWKHIDSPIAEDASPINELLISANLTKVVEEPEDPYKDFTPAQMISAIFNSGQYFE